ncbi:unannotated protein [freshwater metagenome]|uniref:Unannotated protein n=1 Tax=freshwater metagenome TaxID=449393 RepID=A0A6J6S5N6_9ZZZZ|nr:DUF2304 family protein [Actinomycetota bacterium]MSY78247.1 DUF2304 family protein [Actinomycetota bacterium]MTA63158.1 DUF2304 family protein [Actinomycetota bacterium]
MIQRVNPMRIAELFATDTAEPVSDGALTTRAHVFVIAVTLLSVFFIIRLVRRHKLRTKYSLLWIVVAIALATIAVFPGLLEAVSRAAGVYYPPATFLILSVGFLFLIVVHFSWEFSRSEERIRTLAEDLALLRASHEELAEQLRNQSGQTQSGGSDTEDSGEPADSAS